MKYFQKSKITKEEERRWENRDTEMFGGNTYSNENYTFLYSIYTGTYSNENYTFLYRIYTGTYSNENYTFLYSIYTGIQQ